MRDVRRRLAALLRMAACWMLFSTSLAFAQAKPTSEVSADGYSPEKALAIRMKALARNANVKRGLDLLKADDARTLQEQKAIVVIPAPAFKERKRAEFVRGRFQELGLKDVRVDEVGNVLGVRPGVRGESGRVPRLLIGAHLDTVFSEDTGLAVRESDGKLYAPGISDNARGIAALLSVVRAMNEVGIQTIGDVVFVANVGEEGLGDLRGMKALFKDRNSYDGFVSLDIDSTDGAANSITYLATGSRRYEITYTGPGGHSFGAFGTPSAIHAMGYAIAKIDLIAPPKEPKTTFTVGTVTGGTSVNTIAADASMLIDMRSNSPEELAKLETTVLGIAKEAAVAQNRRWNSDKMTVEIKRVGDRPAGQQAASSSIVQIAWLASKEIGMGPKIAEASSTDANIPLSLGIPAINLTAGGRNGGTHTREEWFDPTNAYMGPQRLFLAALALVGVPNVTEPALPVRRR